MTINLIPSHEVAEEDRRNSKWRYLPTDGICTICGAINNLKGTDNCVICECDCGNNSFIYGQLSMDLRKLLNFHIEDLRDLCEIRGIHGTSRVQMTVRLLRDFHDERGNRYRFDDRVNELLIKKVLKRNIKKFRFTVDIDCAVRRVKKEIKLKLVEEKDVLKG